MSRLLMQAKNISKSYIQGNRNMTILNDIDFEISEGEAVCIVGASGAGKSTLLHILGTLDRPNGGSLTYQGQDLFAFSDDQLAEFRNQTMGFVFQFHHLLYEFTALENVMMPSRIGGEQKSMAQAKARTLLNDLGLGDRVSHFPNQLSGGELQRVAIARALIRNPKILFADEPTGNLDTKNSAYIQDLFFRLHQQKGLTLIVVTHDIQFANRFNRVLRLSDGKWL